MNAVEIEEAVSLLAEQPFEADAFPYAFLEAFGNKATTIKRLKTGETNKSDVGGVLQRGNIHIKTCAGGEVAATLVALRDSPATAKQKARFILATDGSDFHVLQHPWLEHLSGAQAHRIQQSRPHPLRRGYPSCPRGAFSRHHRRAL